MIEKWRKENKEMMKLHERFSAFVGPVFIYGKQFSMSKI